MLTGTNKEIRRRRIVGAIIIVVVPVLIAIGTVRPDPRAPDTTVTLMFDEAKGLAKVNRDVRVAGVNVGVIGDVTRVGDDAKIELKLRPEAGTIYKDATASLRPHAAFEGDAFIDLDPGTPGAGQLGGGMIPKDQTAVYVALDESLRGFDAPRREALQSIIAEQSKTATPEAEEAIGKILSQTPAALKAAGPAARAMRGPKGDELRDTIRDLAIAAPAVGSRADKLPGIVRNAEQTLAAVNVDNGQVLDEALVSLPGAINDLRDRSGMLISLTSKISDATKKAGPVLEEATPLLKDGAPLLKKAAPIVEDAPPLVTEIQGVLTDLSGASGALRALIKPVNTAVDDLDKKALPSLTKKSRLGQSSIEQFLSAGAGLTAALSPFQTRANNQLLGAGHYMRVSGDLLNGLIGMVGTLPASLAASASECAEGLINDPASQRMRAQEDCR
ncbi:MAG: MCE family protein [Solirubrobacteraceae bacterium]|nr:MCE family protein [Solirubrobacteraceae bacterium]